MMAEATPTQGSENVRAWKPKFTCIPGVAIACMFIGYLLFIHAFVVNVPIHDEWNMLIFVEKYYHGTFDWSLLWEQYLENRMVVAQLLLLLLAKGSALNLTLEIYGSALVLASEVGAVLVLFRTHGKKASWWGVAAAVLLFTLAQYEGTLWALMITNFITIACAIWAVVIMRKPSSIGMVGALLLGIVAVLSTVEGFLVWPAVFIMLLIRSTSWKLRLLWIVSGLIVGGVYAFGYQFGGGQVGTEPFIAVLQHPLASAAFFAALYGVPLSLGAVTSSHAIPAVLGGIVVVMALGCVVYWWRNGRQDPQLTAGVACIVFALVYGCMVSLGRAPYGVGLAFVSRYVTYTVVIYVGILLVLASSWDNISRSVPRGSNQLALGIVILCCVQMIFSIRVGLLGGEATSQADHHAVALLHELDTLPLGAFHHTVFNNTGDYRDVARFLRAHHLSIWHQ